MTKYNAHKNDAPITSVSLGGKEYKAKDGVIDVPDDHQAAHADAQNAGLTVHSDTHTGAEKAHNGAEAPEKGHSSKSHR